MRIANNIMAMNTHRMYTLNNSNVAKSAEKLSSGYRINRAGDDAAGLAISEKMRAQIRGLNMASKNSQDAVSLIQTAEGALQEVHSMLQRMNELAVQSGSGTNDTGVDRAALQQEFSNLQDEIDQIASTTTFNDMKLLDGDMGAGSSGGMIELVPGGATPKQMASVFANAGVKVEFAAGTAGTASSAAWTGDTVKVTLEKGKNYNAADINTLIRNATGTVSSKVGKEGVSVNFTGSAAQTSFGTSSVTTAAAKQASYVGTNATFKSDVFGAVDDVGSLSIVAGSTEGVTVATASGDATLTIESDKEYTAAEINTLLKNAGVKYTAEFTGKKTGDDIKDGLGATPTQDGGGAAGNGTLTIQVGAEQGQTLNLSIGAMNTRGLSVSKRDTDIASQASAQLAITTTRSAINQVSTQRAEMGAMQNRLEHKISNLDNTAENLQSAESRIRDVDVAKEMTNFTKNNILSQAATAMLAQANAAPQGVLSLLQ